MIPIAIGITIQFGNSGRNDFVHPPGTVIHIVGTLLHCPSLGELKPSPLGDGFSARAADLAWNMAEYRRGSHTVFEIHLHLVWITKYRRPALGGEVATRARDLIRDVCGQHEVSIMKGHMAKDHVHLNGINPAAGDDQPIAAMVEGENGAPAVGGVPAPEDLKKQFWGRHL